MMKLAVQKRLNSPHGDMVLDVDLSLEQGQMIGLYGKSGAGKTSLLRIIAGLFPPDKASIKFDKQTWVDTEQSISLRPQERKIGFVFQDYALFPNMSVRENLEFALLPGQALRVIDELIDISELGQLQTQYPDTLSGGQQQRVALARSLVQRPQLLLLDEPLSAVDQEMRHKLRQHLLLLHRRFKLTTILISHSQEELEQMVDQVVLLENGKVLKYGPPDTVLPPKPNPLQIHGKIYHIATEDKGAWIEIHTNEQRLKIWIDTSIPTHLNIGDTIRIQPNPKGWTLL